MSRLASVLSVLCFLGVNCGVLTAAELAAAQPSSSSAPASRQAITFFENRIRPVLIEHCYECHAADADALGGQLRLDHAQGLLQGGQSGPALIPGDPDGSLLVRALRYDGIEMPPDAPLDATVVADFERWIARGAADPRTAETPTPRRPPTTETLWSLQPVKAPPLPEVRRGAWPLRPLDRFVLHRLEDRGMEPAEQADARSLVRRLFIDLTGLPPSWEQARDFVAAAQADRQRAVERLVDDLLASPQFGERWGRHWLDIARYAESNGNDGLGRNPTFPHAWRYRDYVIDAFNRDLPYDQFLVEQIAGDLLPAESPQQADRHKVATGFLALGAKPAKAMNNNFAMDVVADQIEVIGTGVMALSVGCARCHDHKFDPIPMRDYYALAGIFTSTETMWGLAGNEKLTAPPTDLHVLRAAPKNPPPEDFVETVVLLESATGKPKAIPKPKWPVGTPLAMGVRDREQPADCKLNLKGDAKKLGDAVPRGFLSVLPLEGDGLRIDPQRSGRLALARWLTHPQHPLTARVMVNRVFARLFGDGLVRTPDDFGVYGQRPTHPQLLDHLASRFMQGGWSIKRLIRELATSRTYQLSSRIDRQRYEADPENRWLARHRRRRLDAESLRDSMLHASGALDLAPARGSIIQHRDLLVNLAGKLHQPSNHRSVYLCYLRSSPPPELAAFDLPEFTAVTGQREVSTVPGQALHLLNSPFVAAQGARLGRRVMAQAGTDRQRVTLAYRAALRRTPSDPEMAAALELVRATERELDSKPQAWGGLCHALLITNEFRYVD